MVTYILYVITLYLIYKNISDAFKEKQYIIGLLMASIISFIAYGLVDFKIFYWMLVILSHMIGSDTRGTSLEEWDFLN